MGGVFAQNTNLETKFPSPIGSGNFSSLDWYFSQILLPSMIHLYKIVFQNVIEITSLNIFLGNRPEKKQTVSIPGGFAPPPLPPRPVKGNKVYPNKPILHPNCKMKHLDWSRIILKDGKCCS